MHSLKASYCTEACQPRTDRHISKYHDRYGKGLTKWQWIGVMKFIRPRPTSQHSSQTQRGQVFQELLSFKTFRGIRIQEVGAEFHIEVITRHTEQMQFQQVMVIKNLPEWVSVTDTSMHPPTFPGSDNFLELNVAQFLRKYQEDGTIGSEATAIFTDVTKGHISTSVAIMVPQDNTCSAYLKAELIKSLFHRR
jgi:hypothetical protein